MSLQSPVGHHVQHSTHGGCLVEGPGSTTIQLITHKPVRQQKKGLTRHLESSTVHLHKPPNMGLCVAAAFLSTQKVLFDKW
jgi:hypothetical protein